MSLCGLPIHCVILGGQVAVVTIVVLLGVISYLIYRRKK